MIKARFLGAGLALMTVFLMLCSCQTGENSPGGSQNGIPNNTVSHQPDSEPSTEPSYDSAQPSESMSQDSSLPQELTEQAEASIEDSQKEPDGEDEQPTVSYLMAMECMELLNSDKVHAKLIEALSYDAEEASSIEREYYVDGESAVYINGHQKIIIDGGIVTVIDTEESTYYSYPKDDGEELGFGFGQENYTLEDITVAEDGTTTEVYSVNAHGSRLKSTWTFSPDGGVTVADVSEFGSFNYYIFEIIEGDTSGMDLTLPQGLTLIQPEDIM